MIWLASVQRIGKTIESNNGFNPGRKKMEAKTVEKYNRLQSARALGILKVQSFRVFCVPLEKQLFFKSHQWGDQQITLNLERRDQKELEQLFAISQNEKLICLDRICFALQLAPP